MVKDLCNKSYNINLFITNILFLISFKFLFLLLVFWLSSKAFVCILFVVQNCVKISLLEEIMYLEFKNPLKLMVKSIFSYKQVH